MAGTDKLVCSVTTASADATVAGPQSAIVHLGITGSHEIDTTFAVSLTITTTVSPLTSSVNPIPLSYLVGGGANQASAAQAVTIHSVDTVYEPYTIPTLPSWLTAVPVNYRADAAFPDSIAFKVVAANVPASVGTLTTTVHFGNHGQSQPTGLVDTCDLDGNHITVGVYCSIGAAHYIKGSGTGTLSNHVNITVGAGSLAFTLNIGTVPPWRALHLPLVRQRPLPPMSVSLW